MKKTLAIVLIMLSILTGCSSGGFSVSSDIHVVSREDGSGTRSSFVSLAGVEKTDENGKTIDATYIEAIITNSTSVVMMTISGDPHAIGYLSLGSLGDTVKALSVDGVLPTEETIQQGKYPLARPFLIVTLEKQENQLIEDFIFYITSKQGQEIVSNNGYVGINDAIPYDGDLLSGKIVVGGSSSVSPLMEKLIESYIIIQTDVTIELQQSDSTTGVASVHSGAYDIGMSSRLLKESEISQGILPKSIATDGIVVIVNKENPIENLSLDEVRKIFVGEHTTWNEIEGGRSEK